MRTVKKMAIGSVAILTLGLSACQEVVGDDQTDVTTFSYSYDAIDSAGNDVASGRIMISLAQDSSVTGEWAVTAIPGAGPQNGEGQLTGSLSSEGFFTVNLNPDVADNNVQLTWGRQQGVVEGTWQWTTFAGPQTGGDWSGVPLRTE